MFVLGSLISISIYITLHLHQRRKRKKENSGEKKNYIKSLLFHSTGEWVVRSLLNFPSSLRRRNKESSWPNSFSLLQQPTSHITFLRLVRISLFFFLSVFREIGLWRLLVSEEEEKLINEIADCSSRFWGFHPFKMTITLYIHIHIHIQYSSMLYARYTIYNILWNILKVSLQGHAFRYTFQYIKVQEA